MKIKAHVLRSYAINVANVLLLCMFKGILYEVSAVSNEMSLILLVCVCVLVFTTSGFNTHVNIVKHINNDGRSKICKLGKCENQNCSKFQINTTPDTISI